MAVAITISSAIVVIVVIIAIIVVIVWIQKGRRGVPDQPGGEPRDDRLDGDPVPVVDGLFEGRNPFRPRPKLLRHLFLFRNNCSSESAASSAFSSAKSASEALTPSLSVPE